MKNNLIAFLGEVRDFRGLNDDRWKAYRPTIAAAMCDLEFDTFYLLYSDKSEKRALLDITLKDIASVNDRIKVIPICIDIGDMFEPVEVLNGLYEFVKTLPVSNGEKYTISTGTGTHMAHIAFFDLIRRNIINGQLIQLHALSRHESKIASKQEFLKGHYRVIDFNLPKYDKYQSLLCSDAARSCDLLKGGIKTNSNNYNKLIETIERISLRNNLPILVGGPTGSGKTQLAKRIFDIKKLKGIVTGDFKYINCATLRPDMAHSVLFGHKKGSFTGSSSDRDGLLKQADNGVLFLDEIGEMSLDVQAMLLSAIETKRFYPLGSDQEVESNFTIICGTNVDLVDAVKKGTFRDDLLARIDTWHFVLPSLSERIEDIEPNIDHELRKYEAEFGEHVRFNTVSRKIYLEFALNAKWSRNFRDLSSSILRLCTLAESGVINVDMIKEEIHRLNVSWGIPSLDTDCNDGENGVSNLSYNICDGGSSVSKAERLYRQIVGDDCRRNIQEYASIIATLNVCLKFNTAKEAAIAVYGDDTGGNPTSRINGYLLRNTGTKFSDIKKHQLSLGL